MSETQKKLILIVNDDGAIHPGITTLETSLASVGEVWTVAPDRERSGVSHSISIFSPLSVTRLGERKYAVSGSPADCVWIAIQKLLPRRPDLVVSGINAGANLGSDVWYSGTVHGAAEGVLMGSDAIAFSAEYTREGGCNFEAVAEFAARFTQAFFKLSIARPALLNVNVPYAPKGSPAPKKARITRLGQRLYKTGVKTLLDARGREFYWAEGHVEGHKEIPFSDCVAIAEGVISITPLHLEMTALNRLGELDGKLSINGCEIEPYKGETTPLPPDAFAAIR